MQFMSLTSRRFGLPENYRTFAKTMDKWNLHVPSRVLPYALTMTSKAKICVSKSATLYSDNPVTPLHDANDRNVPFRFAVQTATEDDTQKTYGMLGVKLPLLLHQCLPTFPLL